MKRIEFLREATKLAQQQCELSSTLGDDEFKGIVKSAASGETCMEVEIYKKALEIATDSSYDLDDTFTKVSRDFTRNEDE